MTTHIKDTKDIRVNTYGGHVFFIRPPHGAKEITVYGKEKFHAALDAEIAKLRAQRNTTPAPQTVRCPKCNSTLLKAERENGKTVIRCWKRKNCGAIVGTAEGEW
jgi:uncharacterized protein with PIN domain